jgi:hypothetical protein
MNVFECVATDYLIRILSFQTSTHTIIIGLDEIDDFELQDALRQIKNNNMFLPICMFLNIVIEDTAPSHTKRTHRGGSPYHNIIALLLFLCLNSIVANIIKPSPVIKDFQQKLKNVFQFSTLKQEMIQNVQNIQDAIQTVDNQIGTIINNRDFASQILSLSERGEMHKYIKKFIQKQEDIVNIFSIAQKKLNIANTLLKTIKTGNLKPITEKVRSNIEDNMTSLVTNSARGLGPYINIMITMIKELPENMRSLEDLDRSDLIYGHTLGGKTKKYRHRRRKSLRKKRRIHS